MEGSAGVGLLAFSIEDGSGFGGVCGLVSVRWTGQFVQCLGFHPRSTSNQGAVMHLSANRRNGSRVTSKRSEEVLEVSS